MLPWTQHWVQLYTPARWWLFPSDSSWQQCAVVCNHSVNSYNTNNNNNNDDNNSNTARTKYSITMTTAMAFRTDTTK